MFKTGEAYMQIVTELIRSGAQTKKAGNEAGKTGNIRDSPRIPRKLGFQNWELKTHYFNLCFPKGWKGGIGGTFDFLNVE